MAQKESNIFRLKQFSLANRRGAMKITTDSILLGALAPVAEGCARIADAGAGTGIIALMMAQRCCEAEVTAFEIDPEGYEECAANFASSPWADRLRAVEGDFAVTAPETGVYDLIVSNPPFFNTTTQSPDSRRASARHEGTLTFDTLISTASKILKPSGKLTLIVPRDRVADLEYLAILSGLEPAQIIEIAPSPDQPPIRAVVTFTKGRSNSPIMTMRVDIRTPLDEYSDQYRQLTKDFYLDF